MKIIYFTCFVLFLSACKSPENPVQKKEESGAIILIFTQKPDLGDKETGKIVKLKNETLIAYSDDLNTRQEIKPLHKTSNDTVRITTARDSVSIIHYYYAFEDKFRYTFHRGDTVIFTYADDLPIARIFKSMFKILEIGCKR